MCIIYSGNFSCKANGIWLNEGGIAHRQKLPQMFVAAFVLANVSR